MKNGYMDPLKLLAATFLASILGALAVGIENGGKTVSLTALGCSDTVIQQTAAK